uniref:Uncharacterized protein n=1 Tax=Pyrodinium bahamense TaxID=73915 RepID=A0A7S0AEM7_9DINO|mmetsp:Transcript_32840/g.90707  ORF Transcript_32840/g.90707 Transcript_32840/m.90707 type:complete len:205 (+) Transcript_32840:103-717(+)
MGISAVKIIDGQDYSLPILVTLVYFVLFQLFMVNQVKAKIDAGKGDPAKLNRFDYSNKFWEMADRSFMNFLEQTPAFVSLMWLCAVFCNAESAGTAGLVYCVARAAFPVLWAVKGKWTLLIELSTQPCYAAVNYYNVCLLYLLCTGEQLRALLPSNPVGVVGVVAGLQIACTICVFFPGFAIASLMAKGFAPAGELQEGLVANK